MDSSLLAWLLTGSGLFGNSILSTILLLALFLMQYVSLLQVSDIPCSVNGFKLTFVCFLSASVYQQSSEHSAGVHRLFSCSRILSETVVQINDLIK